MKFCTCSYNSSFYLHNKCCNFCRAPGPVYGLHFYPTLLASERSYSFSCADFSNACFWGSSPVHPKRQEAVPVFQTHLQRCLVRNEFPFPTHFGNGLTTNPTQNLTVLNPIIFFSNQDIQRFFATYMYLREMRQWAEVTCLNMDSGENPCVSK